MSAATLAAEALSHDPAPVPSGARASVADPAIGDEAAALLDDPQEWAAFSRPAVGAAGLVESSIMVDGITCSACAVTIEKVLCAMPGVQMANVSAASRRATVVWSPDAVLPSQWMGEIRKAGYLPLPANDSSARAARLKESRTMLWRWLVAGLCMMQNLWPENRILITTGRISSEMLQKAAQLNAPILISRTSPSSLSIEMAERYGITLIGYARKHRFNVYSNGQRIGVK